MWLNITLRLYSKKAFTVRKTDLWAVLELKMLQAHIIVVMWWIWPIVNSCVVISAPAAALEKLRQLSEPDALETLSRYFDATRDSEVGQIF